MIKIAGVRFRENWKVYDFDATDIDVAVGDRVIVDSERGQGFATVVRLKRQQEPSVPPAEPIHMEQGLQVEEETDVDGTRDASADVDKNAPKVLRKVLRKVTEDDLLREEKNMEREAEAFKAAQDMIAERELPMKLIRVEYSFDASRATFFFFSETRVDFRELVKDLAYKFRSRIEMRQIGVRDVARMIGGFGPCGRELCCASFLKNFEPVSIRMAKKQEMVLNPAKISGVCGRLLCCLSYEYEMYDEIKKDAAGMRDAAVKEKKEEQERRLAEERKEAEERRLAEEKRRQEDLKQQEQRREKQKETQKGGGRPEKRKEIQQEKKGQQPDQHRERQQQQPKQERPPQQEQKTQQPQQGGEKTGKRKKRRFWRKKKKGPQQGESRPPQGPGKS
ncbi:MAG: regulatory iron-sulfur-containing complex subunit RicT [Betaproteobacteria bacterium]